MIVALIALAAVMIIGGVASVVQGFPFVRLESGLAMTIAGATTASAGAVLLGLAAVAHRLKGLERSFADRQERAAPPVPPSLALPSFGQPSFSAADAASPLNAFPPDTVVAGDSSVSGRFAGAAGAVSVRPVLPIFAEPTPLRGPEPERPREVAEPPVEPMPELRSRIDDGIAPEDDLFAGPLPLRTAVAEPPFVPEPEPALEVPAAAAKPEPAHAPGNGAVPVAPEPERKREVVGTYASGGNTYVMYDNGSIQADTPRGRFTFNSLDELKAFVEAGGESDARGAA